jgi:hypothetical protein
MYRQTNIGGTATPNRSLPIALFSGMLPVPAVLRDHHVTGPCGGVENRYHR